MRPAYSTKSPSSKRFRTSGPSSESFSKSSLMTHLDTQREKLLNLQLSAGNLTLPEIQLKLSDVLTEGRRFQLEAARQLKGSTCLSHSRQAQEDLTTRISALETLLLKAQEITKNRKKASSPTEPQEESYRRVTDQALATLLLRLGVPSPQKVAQEPLDDIAKAISGHLASSSLTRTPVKNEVVEIAQIAPPTIDNSKELEALKDKIVQLQEQNKSFEEDNKNLQSKISQLQEQVNNYDAKEYESLTEENTTLNSQVDLLKTELQTLMQKISENEAQGNKEQRSQFELANTDIALAKEVEQVKEQVAELQGEIENHKNTNQKSNDHIAELKNTNTKLKGELAQLTGDISALSDKVKIYQEEAQQKKEIEKLYNELLEQKDRIMEDFISLQKSTSMNEADEESDKNATIASLQIELAEAKSKVQEIITVNGITEAQLKEFEINQDRLCKDIDNFNKTKAIHEAELNQRVDALSTLQSQIDELQQSIDEEKKELESQKAKFAIDQANTSKVHNEETNVLREKIVYLQQTIDDLKDELRSKDQETQLLKAKQSTISTSAEDIDKLNKKIGDLEEQLDRKRTNIKKNEENLKSNSKIINDKEKEITGLKKELEEAKSSSKQELKEVSDIKSELKKAQSNLDLAQKEIKRVKGDLTAKDNKIKSLTQEVENLTSKLESSIFSQDFEGQRRKANDVKNADNWNESSVSVEDIKVTALAEPEPVQLPKAEVDGEAQYPRKNRKRNRKNKKGQQPSESEEYFIKKAAPEPESYKKVTPAPKVEEQKKEAQVQEEQKKTAPKKEEEKKEATKKEEPKKTAPVKEEQKKEQPKQEDKPAPIVLDVIVSPPAPEIEDLEPWKKGLLNVNIAKDATKYSSTYGMAEAIILSENHSEVGGSDHEDEDEESETIQKNQHQIQHQAEKAKKKKKKNKKKKKGTIDGFDVSRLLH